jgi:hypothetical protein
MLPEKKLIHEKYGITFRCARYDNCGWATPMKCQHDKEHPHSPDCNLKCQTDSGLILSDACEPIEMKCSDKCPACAVACRDKEWAKWILEKIDSMLIIALEDVDFEALKKLAGQ